MALLPPPIQHAAEGRLVAGLERVVRILDKLLKHYFRIYEFSDDENCLLRLALTSSTSDVTLSDGTRILPGSPIGELHFWNEHVPTIGDKRHDLSWAINFQHRLIRSLTELAQHVRESPHLNDVAAFRGDIFFSSRCKLLLMANPVKRCGLELVFPPPPHGFRRTTADFFDSLYAFALVWAFNPASLNGRGYQKLKRVQLWISRRTLLSKYGEQSGVPEAAPVTVPVGG